MSFHNATNWQDRLLQIQIVKDKCNHIISRLGLPDHDARAQGIIQVRQFCNTLAAVPIKLQQNAEVKANVPIIMRILGLGHLRDLKSCLGDLNKNAKVSFVAMAQFALENCTERVLDALPGEKSQGTFNESSKRLIRVTKLPDPQIKHEILMVPAWIRNSLHSAGVHGKAGRTVIVDGEPYVFEEGKSVSCATWSHLAHCIGCALSVYEEMLCSPIVTAVSKIEVL